jgi:hypothetical protein
MTIIQASRTELIRNIPTPSHSRAKICKSIVGGSPRKCDVGGGARSLARSKGNERLKCRRKQVRWIERRAEGYGVRANVLHHPLIISRGMAGGAGGGG